MAWRSGAIRVGVFTALVGSLALGTGTSQAQSFGQVKVKAVSAYSPMTKPLTLQNLTEVRATWNRAATNIQPYAVIQSIREDGSGHLFAQVGTHVFLTGFVTPSNYALDIMLDHPLANVRAATEELLPYWQILIQMTQPKASVAEANDIVRKLGLFNSQLTLPDRVVTDAVRIQSHGVQYALSYTGGVVVSAERGPKGTDPNRDLDWETKETMVLSSGSPIYPVSQADVDMHLTQSIPSQISTSVLRGSKTTLFADLQHLVRWTTVQTGLGNPSENGSFPVIAEAGVKDIERQLGRYYTFAFIQHLLHDEAWAYWVRGTVKNGTLVETKHTLYAQGRVFLVPEPPFQEGQIYEFVMPMYSDITNYALGSLTTFGNLPKSALRRMTVTDAQIVVTVSMPQAGSVSPREGTYTFHLKESNGEVLIYGIDVPPYQGA